MTSLHTAIVTSVAIVCVTIFLCFASKCASDMAKETHATERAKFGVREKIEQLERKGDQ